MGLDYSYSIFVSPNEVEPLMKWLAHHSAPLGEAEPPTVVNTPTGQLVVPIGASNPDSTTQHLGGDKPVSMRTTLLFAKDDQLARWDLDRPNAPPEPADEIAVGLVSVLLGFFGQDNQFVRLTLLASTTKMSRLFEESPSIRRTILSAADALNVACIVFDDEDKTDNFGYLVWPRSATKEEGLARRNSILAIGPV
jgi:hypothetical protein